MLQPWRLLLIVVGVGSSFAFVGQPTLVAKRARAVSACGITTLRAARRQSESVKDKPDPYAVLGVGPKATTAEIKKAYRSLAATYHPDVNPDEDAQGMFIKINDAYNLIGDVDDRRRFNLRRHSGVADDFAERVEFMRKTGGTGYVRVAEKVEAMMEDSRLIVLLNIVPMVLLLTVMTLFLTHMFTANFLHDLVLGGPAPAPNYDPSILDQ